MPTKKDTFIADAASNFSELAIHDQREVLIKLQSIHEAALKKRRLELMDELRDLDTPPGDRAAPGSDS